VFRHIWSADLTFTWFASVYSFVVIAGARLLRKPSLVVVAGVDIVSLPDIDYGIWHNPWKRWAVRWALRNATKVLAVDPSLQELTVRQANYDGRNIMTIPTGYDPEQWTAEGVKENIVLTVAGCENDARLKVKGLDFLFAVARRLDSMRFVVVGVRPPLLNSLVGRVPGNVTLEPPTSREALRGYYRRAKVYCLPSRSEGLPNSLCEAMLCECIPVGTAVGGVPRTIGENGFVVPFGDETRLASALQQALSAPPELGKRARKQIEEMFPLSRRSASLERVIGEIGS
jgi:glycosyltransferase involved in cell wall biosynthesis